MIIHIHKWWIIGISDFFCAVPYQIFLLDTGNSYVPSVCPGHHHLVLFINNLLPFASAHIVFHTTEKTHLFFTCKYSSLNTFYFTFPVKRNIFWNKFEINRAMWRVSCFLWHSTWCNRSSSENKFNHAQSCAEYTKLHLLETFVT